jgi:hypothetical protein
MTSIAQNLELACVFHDMDGAARAISQGGLIDQSNIQGLTPIQICLRGSHPDMAIDLQLATEDAVGSKPWWGRDGHNAASMIAMLGNGRLMTQAAQRLPHAIFARNLDGLNPFDLFCERCCASDIFSQEIQSAAVFIGGIANDLCLKTAIGASRTGLQISKDLALASMGDSQIITILESIQLERELNLLITDASRGKGSARL